MSTLALAPVLAHAVTLGASDVHISTKTGIQYRVDGQLMDAPEQLSDNALAPTSVFPAELLKGLSHLAESFTGNKELLDQLQHLSKRLESKPNSVFSDLEQSLRLGEGGSWRVSLYRSDLDSISVALRHLPTTIPQLDDLIPLPLAPYMSVLRRAIERPRGLILTTGATGSGKSTTLAALVNLINQTQRKHIITLEDPVEFWHSSAQSVVRHRQVGIDTPSFAHGLKSALRQDPDVLLLGELRDLETISLAMTAAETGHLVLATLHSRDVRSSLTRIVDVFPPEQQPMIRAQLADSLVGIISQRLEPHAKGQGRVLHPELAILPRSPGGVRSNIHDGRFHQVVGALETMPRSEESCYLSFDTSQQLLLSSGYLHKEISSCH